MYDAPIIVDVIGDGPGTYGWKWSPISKSQVIMPSVGIVDTATGKHKYDWIAVPPSMAIHILYMAVLHRLNRVISWEIDVWVSDP